MKVLFSSDKGKLAKHLDQNSAITNRNRERLGADIINIPTRCTSPLTFT